MGFLVEKSKEMMTMGEYGLWGVQKGNFNRPAGHSVTLLNIVVHESMYLNINKKRA